MIDAFWASVGIHPFIASCALAGVVCIGVIFTLLASMPDPLSPDDED